MSYGTVNSGASPPISANYISGCFAAESASYIFGRFAAESANDNSRGRCSSPQLIQEVFMDKQLDFYQVDAQYVELY